MAEERYTLEKQLGSGGMGDVWLATDTLLNRPVAVKFLQATDEQMYKDLFLSEARTLASLQHPNITLIYDAVFDESENRFYIMMEYVEGQSLAELLEELEGPLPWESLLEVTMGVLHALKYAHAKGVVHRDIKPENVVIQQGGVKLTDFGLAALVSILAEGQEDDAFIFGTPAYMAPEQIVAEGVDGRADLYALGVMLFELAAGGRRPFNYTDRREIFRAHVEEPPPSVREFEPTVPLMLDRIILKLLSKHPDDRYPSAEALLDVFKSMQARQRFNQRYRQLLDPDAKPLVGRSDVLKQIEQIWAKTRESNEPQLLIVRGEMGSGKSRLIAEFLGNSIIDKRLEAFVGRCNEVGAPYAPFAEVLAAIIDKGIVNQATIETHMDQIFGQVPGLASLLNIDYTPKFAEEKLTRSSGGLWETLSSRLPDSTGGNSLKAQWEFFAAVLSILVEVGPAVIFLDDAIFLDEPSVAMTHFLIRQVNLPLLIVAESEDNSKTVPWFETFGGDEIEIIDLNPLSREAVASYSIDFLEGSVSDAAITIIEKRGRGNPFHIEELIRQMVDAGDFYRSADGEWRYKPPEDTADLTQELISPFLLSAFTRRLEKLTEKSREILALAAIIEPGPEFSFNIWLALLGGESQRAVAQEALQEGLDRRLLRAIGSSHYSFRPADVAKVLLSSISSSHQRDLHRQCAEILIEAQSDPILIGYHFEQAGLATESARYLEAAGARAMTANAINQAINCYARATELVETLSAYVALGTLYRQRGAWGDSVNAFERALELVKTSGDLNDEARILNGLSFTLWLSDQYRRASQFASQVLKLDTVSEIEHATAQSHLGMISWVLGHLREAESWCRKSVDILAGSGDEAHLAAAYNRLGLVYYSRGKFPDAVKVTALSLDIRSQLQDHWGQAYCMISLGKIAAIQGDFETASSFFDSAHQLFETIGSMDGLMVVHTEQSRMLLQQGQANEALPIIGKAMRLAQDLGKKSSYGLGDIYLLIAQASLANNQIERAQAAADNALELVEAAGNQEYIARGWAILAQIYTAEGKDDMADQLFEKTLDLFEQVGNPSGLLRTKLAYAAFLTDRGDPDRATRLEYDARKDADVIGLHL